MKKHVIAPINSFSLNMLCSSRPKQLCKIDVLKKYRKIHCELCEILKNTLFIGHLRASASEYVMNSG